MTNEKQNPFYKVSSTGWKKPSPTFDIGPRGPLSTMTTVEMKFTDDGVSLSAYDSDASLVDEAWFTWAEVGDLKGDGAAATFNL